MLFYARSFEMIVRCFCCLLHRFIICRTKISIGGTEEEFEYKVSLGLQKRIAGSLDTTARQDKLLPISGQKERDQLIRTGLLGGNVPLLGIK